MQRLKAESARSSNQEEDMPGLDTQGQTDYL